MDRARSTTGFVTAHLNDETRLDAVDDRAVVREDDVVVAVACGQRRQAGAVEVDPVDVEEVRILARVHAAGGEEDLLRPFVDLDHRAHDPLALRNLVLRASGGAVDQVEMVPAVALRHPDHVLAVLEVVAILLARVGEVAVGGAVVEEGLRLLRDDRARLPGGRVRFDDAEHLVAALVVFEGDGAAVLAPLEARQVVRVGEERVVDGELGARREVEDDRLRQRQRVAGLRVDVDRVFRLQLIGGGGLDVVHFAAVARADAVGGDFLRVRRPGDRAELVGVPFGAVGTERDFVLLGRGVAHGEVVVPDQRFLRAVR